VLPGQDLHVLVDHLARTPRQRRRRSLAWLPRSARSSRAQTTGSRCAGGGRAAAAHAARLAGPVLAEEVANNALLALDLRKELALAGDLPVLAVPTRQPLLRRAPAWARLL